jgi:hypothetical protein
MCIDSRRNLLYVGCVSGTKVRASALRASRASLGCRVAVLCAFPLVFAASAIRFRVSLKYRALCAGRVAPNPILGRMCDTAKAFVHTQVGASLCVAWYPLSGRCCVACSSPGVRGC